MLSASDPKRTSWACLQLFLPLHIYVELGRVLTLADEIIEWGGAAFLLLPRVSPTVGRSRIRRWKLGVTVTKTSLLASTRSRAAPGSTAQRASASRQMKWKRRHQEQMIRRTAATGAIDASHCCGLAQWKSDWHA
jgi:hypothetical protein